MKIRQSRLRKLITTITAFRHFTFWLTPKKENSIGYFWPRKDKELAATIRDIHAKGWPVDIHRYMEWMKQHQGK